MKRVEIFPGRFVWVSDEMLDKAHHAFNDAPDPVALAEIASVEDLRPWVRVLFGRKRAGAARTSQQRVGMRRRANKKP